MSEEYSVELVNEMEMVRIKLEEKYKFASLDDFDYSCAFEELNKFSTYPAA